MKYVFEISTKPWTEAATGGTLSKKLILNILQYLPENISVGTSFNQVGGLWACNYIKNRLEDRCFPLNIAKFLL